VVLDTAVTGITPAKLPKANSLSSLSGSQSFASVGYGAYEVTNGPGGHEYLYNDVRMVATGTLNSMNKAWLRISMNPSTGNGGTCYGDSGGPNFLGSSNIVAAIRSRATRCAARPTWTTGSTPSRRERSSRST